MYNKKIQSHKQAIRNLYFSASVLFFTILNLSYSSLIISFKWDLNLSFALLNLIQCFNSAIGVKVLNKQISSKLLITLIPVPALIYFLNFTNHYFALVSLLNCYFLYILYSESKKHITTKKHQKIMNFLYIFAIMFLVLHFLSCSYIAIYSRQEQFLLNDLITRYNIAFYWAVTTLTTVGYGDLTPFDNFSRMFTVFAMLIGVGFYGVVIGQFATYITAQNKRQESQNKQIEELEGMLTHYQIPRNLQLQTIGFFDHILQRSVINSENELLAKLPTTLRNEIQVYINIRPISHIDLFVGCSFECWTDAAKMLVTNSYKPNDIVFNKGDVGKNMYIISFGEVQVVSNGKVLATLKQGQCFGETALFLDLNRNADIITNSFCDLFVLGKSDFTKLVSKHRDLRDKIENIIENLQNKSA